MMFEIPEGMEMEQAAGIYITFPTSYAALVIRAELRRGETVLVHAGAGGVGIAACQIAKGEWMKDNVDR
jgi:NADPH:quinone reductase